MRVREGISIKIDCIISFGHWWLAVEGGLHIHNNNSSGLFKCQYNNNL